MRRFVVLAVLAAAPASAQSFVVANARVHTVDDARPEAQSFAVVDGHFATVGTTDAVRRAHPNLPVYDLRGATVVPGLIDAHGHLMGLAMTTLSADLVGTTSKADVVARLQAFAAARPVGTWIVGRGWDQNDWPAAADGSHPFPTRADLDAAFPDRPVYLTRIDGHAAWANTAALRAAGGLDSLARVPDTNGGRQERDAQGVPTGVFVDEAMDLVGRRVPEPSDADLDRALTAALEQTARLGLTGVHDMGVDSPPSTSTVAALPPERFRSAWPRTWAGAARRSTAFATARSSARTGGSGCAASSFTPTGRSAAGVQRCSNPTPMPTTSAGCSFRTRRRGGVISRLLAPAATKAPPTPSATVPGASSSTPTPRPDALPTATAWSTRRC